MSELTEYEKTLEAAVRSAYLAISAALDSGLDKERREHLERTKLKLADAVSGAIFWDASKREYTSDPFAGLGL